MEVEQQSSLLGRQIELRHPSVAEVILDRRLGRMVDDTHTLECSLWHLCKNFTSTVAARLLCDPGSQSPVGRSSSKKETEERERVESE